MEPMILRYSVSSALFSLSCRLWSCVVSGKGVFAGLQFCMPKPWTILRAYIDWERWIGPVGVGQ